MNESPDARSDIHDHVHGSRRIRHAHPYDGAHPYAPVGWKAAKGRDGVPRVWANGELVAEVFSEADAHAIAALPDLLQAARAALAPVDGGQNEYADYLPSNIYDALRAAIDKADAR